MRVEKVVTLSNQSGRFGFLGFLSGGQVRRELLKNTWGKLAQVLRLILVLGHSHTDPPFLILSLKNDATERSVKWYSSRDYVEATRRWSHAAEASDSLLAARVGPGPGRTGTPE